MVIHSNSKCRIPNANEESGHKMMMPGEVYWPMSTQNKTWMASHILLILVIGGEDTGRNLSMGSITVAH